MDRSSFGKYHFYLVDEVITFRRLPVWLGDLDPVIIVIILYACLISMLLWLYMAIPSQ